MAGLLDVLFPPWARDLVSSVEPMRTMLAQFNAMQDAAGRLFGTGENPPELPPPPLPLPPPDPGGSGPAHEQIGELTQQIQQLQEQIAAMQAAAAAASTQSGANSQDGRSVNDGLRSDEQAIADALAPQAGTPEGHAAALAAMQQQIDALNQNVADKATNAQGIADMLRNVGSAMPGMGMPGMGMPGLGMPGGLPLGGIGGPPVTPLTPGPMPEVTAKPLEDSLAPPPVNSVANRQPDAPPQVETLTPDPPLQVSPPLPAAAAAASPPSSETGRTAERPATLADTTPGDRQITLPSGQMVTAPNAAAAEAVRAALKQPAGAGDVATTAYADTGVSIPTDGDEPGRKIDPADLQPGDIAVFDDHTALVAGNGQLVDSDGQLQPLGVINDSNNFHGFYRPTETVDTPAAVTPPEPAGVSTSATTAPTSTVAPPLMAAPAVSASGTPVSKPIAEPSQDATADNVR